MRSADPAPDPDTIGYSGPRLRFAPSPNGYLHLGHAFSALMNQRIAASAGGTVLLRLEDIDTARCGEVFAAAIMDDLAWLGFQWCGPVLRQSQRFPIYASVLDRLDRAGLTYPCFCTRGDIARAARCGTEGPRDPDGSLLYPGTCRTLSPSECAQRIVQGRPAARRLDMAAALDRCGREQTGALGWAEFGETGPSTWIAADPALWGDVLVARKDMPTSYHIAVVTDDAAQGITHVVRGADLFQATSLHRLLQVLLGLPAPSYYHHRLILDEAGRKLSKSHDAPSLQALRQNGATPAAIRARLGF